MLNADRHSPKVLMQTMLQVVALAVENRATHVL